MSSAHNLERGPGGSPQRRPSIFSPIHTYFTERHSGRGKSLSSHIDDDSETEENPTTPQVPGRMRKGTDDLATFKKARVLIQGIIERTPSKKDTSPVVVLRALRVDGVRTLGLFSSSDDYATQLREAIEGNAELDAELDIKGLGWKVMTQSELAREKKESIKELEPSASVGKGKEVESEFQDDPSEPLRESDHVEWNTGSARIRCSCLDEIHGYWSSSSNEPVTLIVLRLSFDSRMGERRIQDVNITLHFAGMEAGGSDPEVEAIAPDGTFTLVPTTRHKEITRGGRVALGPEVATRVGTAKGILSLEKAVSRDVTDYAMVNGWMSLGEGDLGPRNCASWTLLENKTEKTGVPKAMRTAIRLKRKDQNPFKCIVKIDVRVGFKSSVMRMFEGKPKDNSMEFDPGLAPTNYLHEYDIKELGDFDIASMAEVEAHRS
jgi:hypothetical protein